MGKLNIYVRKNHSTYYFKDKEELRGFIEEKDITGLLEEKNCEVINFIFSKPDVIFRKFIFDFVDIKKIRMVLPSEIEETIPDKIENYLFDYKFIKQKGKTQVNVVGVKNEIIKTLTSTLKGKKRIKFFLDSEILYLALKNSIKEENYVEFYVDKFYLLLNIVEKGILSACLSYKLENGNFSHVISLTKTVIEEKKYQVFATGENNLIENIEKELGHSVNKIFLVEENLHPFFFSEIINYKNFPHLKLVPPFVKILNPVPFLFSFLILILLIFPPVILHNKLSSRTKQLQEIEGKMIDEFKSVFPDVKRIVNPVVQVKEKLSNIENNSSSFQYLSMLDLLAEVTKIFPEEITVEIDSLSFTNNILILSGYIDNLQNLEKVKEEIKKSSFFYDFEIGNISFDRNRVNFNLTLKVKK